MYFIFHTHYLPILIAFSQETWRRILFSQLPSLVLLRCTLKPLLAVSLPQQSLPIFLFIYLFIFLDVLGLRCCVRAFLQLQRAGATLPCGAQASHCGGFSCCRAWALGARASVVVAHGLQQLWLTGSRAQAQQLWRMGLVALQHVGSSWTRARTRVPCIGRRILNHCATREDPSLPIFYDCFSFPYAPLPCH